MEFVKKVEELKFSGNIAENWRVFWQNFQVFAIAIELEKKSEPVKVAVFLNAIGPDALDVFNSLNLSDNDRKKYDAVTKAFEDFCKPKRNEVYESFIFHSRSQGEGEPFDNFLMDVKKTVRKCGFENENRMVRDRIVLGTNDKKLQRKLLDTANLTMEMAIDFARAAEASNEQMAKIQGGSAAVDVIRKNEERLQNKGYNSTFNKKKQKQVYDRQANGDKSKYSNNNYITNCTF